MAIAARAPTSRVKERANRSEHTTGVGAEAACDDLSVKPASEAFLITGNWFDVRLAAANRIRGALKAALWGVLALFYLSTYPNNG